MGERIKREQQNKNPEILNEMKTKILNNFILQNQFSVLQNQTKNLEFSDSIPDMACLH